MAMSSGSSDFMKQMKPETNAAVKKTAGDPVKYGGIINLPPGIENGVAHLTECGFFKYKPESTMKMADGKSAVGWYYFRAAGVVKEPFDIVVPGKGKIRVEGKQTSVMVNCFDTKDSKGKVISQADNMMVVENYLKLLGATKESLDEGVANFEAIALALKTKSTTGGKPIYFEFTTSGGKVATEGPYKGKPPRTFENWGKKLTDYTPTSRANNVVEKPAEEAQEPQPEEMGKEQESPEVQAETIDEQPPDETQTETASIPSDDELDALAKKADAKAASPTKQKAAETIQSAAIAVGIPLGDEDSTDPETVNGCPSYTALVALIKTKRDEAPAEEEQPAEPEPVIPQAGEVWFYNRTNKDGKPLKDINGKELRPLSVTVKSVNQKTSTCDVISNIDKKPIAGVSFVKLTAPV